MASRELSTSPKRNAFTAILGAALLVAVVHSLSPASALVNCSVSVADLVIDSEEQDLLNRVNAYRAANGRAPLTPDTSVTRAAAWFSRDMATKNYFPVDHVDSFGRGVGLRLQQCDVSYTAAAENIAAGNATGAATFEQWRTSTDHNANMLLQGVNLAGIARAFDAGSQYGWYWTLDLTAGSVTSTTSSSTTIAPTTSSTSSSTSSSSTSSTSAPTSSTSSSSTSSSSTSSTSAPTSSTSTPGSTSPSSTSTTLVSTTTTSIATPAIGCAALLEQRTRVNSTFSAHELAIRQRPSSEATDAALAELERIRAATNARLDAALADLGCQVPVVAGAPAETVQLTQEW